MKLFCPICGKEVPDEDKEVLTAPDAKLICQVQCRSCDKVFTICEESKFLKVHSEGRPIHPEN